VPVAVFLREEARFHQDGGAYVHAIGSTDGMPCDGGKFHPILDLSHEGLPSIVEGPFLFHSVSVVVVLGFGGGTIFLKEPVECFEVRCVGIA